MSSHPQPTMPPRQFSPQQSPPNQTYQLPPNKRAKLSPVGMTLTMPSAATTPLASPQPHTPVPIPTTHITTTAATTISQIPYSNAKLAPLPATAMPSMPSMPSVITNMGPPAITPASSFSNDATRLPPKPAAKAAHAYEMDDMLMGTGIDLEEEAEYMNNLDSRAGGQSHVYGPGPATQLSNGVNARTQEDIEAEQADIAWNEHAVKYAREISQEINNSFLEPGLLHRRLQEIVLKQGLTVNVDLKPEGGRFSGRHQNPAEFPKPEIRSFFHHHPDGTTVQVHSSHIPPDAYLVDQLSLLSLGTKQYLRTLVGDANRIATTRQTTTHGVIPQEWQDVAVPLPAVNGTQGESPRTGAESAVSPRTNPLKRTADELSNGLPTPVSEASPTNHLIDAFTTNGKGARNTEENRLRKRLKRQEKQNGEKEGADGTSRAGSVAPGTPGSIAPEPGEKPAPKKESKKAASKQEASSTTVNATLGLFVGSKKKKYSWMTQAAGGSGSGTSTPRLPGAGPGAPGGTNAGGKAQQGPLTKAGVSHLGQFREDSEKGKNIQLRDWVVILEEHGTDPRSLQNAYSILDRSWKGGVENTST
ncbi:uncharacterized protein GGS22DRAFT_144832 [Annulohypoxylon maeteangense]|uniref:uncharacterized protein n=1 Tax=Annulohypoxylon maeteangense TaxID=1927788 RepID=UPI002007A13D|nr:uncharacterized protein GGS22DRAFT_144832 [Annulohypoxylon maeteangense]KAI0884616.1 hypothetical protein GGS22DRAFT_144832 [Annulohypoxylon maeteangense]